jgi:hypothetical protein
MIQNVMIYHAKKYSQWKELICNLSSKVAIDNYDPDDLKTEYLFRGRHGIYKIYFYINNDHGMTIRFSYNAYFKIDPGYKNLKLCDLLSSDRLKNQLPDGFMDVMAYHLDILE